MPVEPLSITVACTSLISNVGKLSLEIYSFVSRVRGAHRDLDAVLKELSSLGLTLETLRNDAMVSSRRVPQPLEHRVLLVLVNTAEVVKDMREMLDNLSSDKFGNKMRWAVYGENDMNKLRSRLESHKASLEIALALLTLSLSTAIKDDTSSIRRNVKDTVLGLDEIAAVLAALPERIAMQLQSAVVIQSSAVETTQIQPLPLPAPEGPILDSALTLESLFPTNAATEQEPIDLSMPSVDLRQASLPEFDTRGGNLRNWKPTFNDPIARMASSADDIPPLPMQRTSRQVNEPGNKSDDLQPEQDPLQPVTVTERGQEGNQGSVVGERAHHEPQSVERGAMAPGIEGSAGTARQPVMAGSQTAGLDDGTQKHETGPELDGSNSQDSNTLDSRRTFLDNGFSNIDEKSQDQMPSSSVLPPISVHDANTALLASNETPRKKTKKQGVKVVDKDDFLSKASASHSSPPQSGGFYNTMRRSASADNTRDEDNKIQVMAQNNVSRQMYSSNPPAAVTAEERRRQETLRASAVSMARKMFAIQQAQIDEVKGVERPHYAAYTARQQSQLDAKNQPVPIDRESRYKALEAATRILGQRRRAEIHDEGLEYRQNNTPQRSRIFLQRSRRSDTPDADDDSDTEQGRRIRAQMSLFPAKLTEVDSKKRQADRDALLAAAHRNVTTRMKEMDEKMSWGAAKSTAQGQGQQRLN